MQRQLPRTIPWFGYCAVALLLLLEPSKAVLAQKPSGAASTLQVPEQYLLRNEQEPLNPTAALVEGQQALQQASRKGDSLRIGAAYVAIGNALGGQRNYDEALRYFKRAEQTYRQRRNQTGRVQALRHIGRTLYAQGDTGQAHNTALQALRLSQKLSEPAEVARSYAQLGEMYGRQQLWARALASHERAYTEWQQAAKPNGQVAALNDIGLAHFQLHHHSRALYYLNRALSEARQLRDSIRTGEALASTAQVYEQFGNYEEAKQLYRQALIALPRATAPARQAEGLRALAVAHDSVGNPAAAIQVLLQALPLARRGNSATQLNGLYQALTSLYRQQGDYRNALAAQMQSASLQDSVFAEQRAAQVAELQTRYESEKKEREIQLLTKDRQIQEATLQRQTLIGGVLAAGALLLLVAVAALYRGRRRQVRINRLLQRKNRAISLQKEELDRLNRTKNTLFSIISHDLRSPLSSLYSLFSLMNMGALPPERLAAHSARLTRTLDVTLHLLDNLLNWSAAQMDGDQVRPEKLQLQAVTEETLALLQGDAERKSIHLLSEVPALSAVRADPNMLRVILRNLLGNAIKFTPSGGSVSVAAHFLEGEGLWAIAVTDTGVGIATTDLPKVFGEEGYHSTLGTALEKGTGLGLRLCKELVQRNGGHISCESQLNIGTTFQFTLPAAGPEVLPLHPTPAVAAVAVG